MAPFVPFRATTPPSHTGDVVLKYSWHRNDADGGTPSTPRKIFISIAACCEGDLRINLFRNPLWCQRPHLNWCLELPIHSDHRLLLEGHQPPTRAFGQGSRSSLKRLALDQILLSKCQLGSPTNLDELLPKIWSTLPILQKLQRQ